MLKKCKTQKKLKVRVKVAPKRTQKRRWSLFFKNQRNPEIVGVTYSNTLGDLHFP